MAMHPPVPPCRHGGVRACWVATLLVALLGSVLTAAQQADFATIDLRGVVNMGWKDEVAGDGTGGWTDQGENDMRQVTPGMTRLLGIPFDLIDADKNQGKAVLTLRSQKFNAGAAKTHLPINRPAASIYFLHASAWTGGHMATYTVQYTDGTSATIPIRADHEITDWWFPHSVGDCRVAFHVTNAQSDDVGMVIYGWNNPHPQTPIAAIDIASEDQNGIVVLAAITLSSAPVSLPDAKDIPLPEYLQSDLPTLDHSQWFPVTNRQDPFQPSVIDQENGLDAPAGKHGFQKNVDGRWVFDDGTPCHLVGTMANPPKSKARAAYLARVLAKYGFTEIRVGHLVTGPGDDSIVDWHREDTQHLNAAYLDQLDYFISELAKNGIYTRISLMWYRSFRRGDHIAGFDEAIAYQTHHPLGDIKDFRKIPLLNSCGICFYHPDLIRLNTDLHLALMAHQNPYRNHLAYGNDPAICQLECCNEDGVFFYSFDHPAPVFEQMLHDRWIAWLKAKYRDDDGLAKAWGEELGGTESIASGHIGRYNLSSIDCPSARQRPRRVADQVHFYADLESGYFTHIRDALHAAGVHQPICGSGWFGAGPTFFADLWANAKLDYIDRHQYWAGGPGGWQILEMGFNTECALTKPELLLKLGGERVFGRPFTISEWANVLPNQFRLEAPPLMAFYGYGLGGWDAPLHFAWQGEADSFADHLQWMWPVNEPSTLCQYPILSRMIRHADITLGPKAFVRNISDAQALSGKSLQDVLVRLDISGPFEQFSSTHGASAKALAATYAGAVGRTGIDFTGAEEKPDASLDLNRYIDTHHRTIHSATGELTWDYGHGVVTANTPRMQAAVGFFPGSRQTLADCDILVDNTIASVLVAPLDDLPLATSKHLLITAVGRSRNVNMAYTRGGQRLLSRGVGPVLLEGVRGSVSLHRSVTCTVQPLDAYGYPCGTPVATQQQAGATVIPLDGRNHAPYYEVTCE